jgi:hypothetical protein
LFQCHKLPCTLKGVPIGKPKGLKYTLEHIPFSCFETVIEKKLQGIRAMMLCPPEDLSLEELTGIFFEDLTLKLTSPGFSSTLKFWSLLAQLTQTDE